MLLCTEAQSGAPASPYHLDLIVATVTKVSDGPATNGNPPRATLEVHQVLRGKLKPGPIEAVWEPAPNDIDTSNRDEDLKRWRATPMDKPKAGQKFILFGSLVQGDKGDVFLVNGQDRQPFSPENLDRALKAVKATEERVAAYRVELAAQKKALAEAQAKWRAAVSADDIARYVREADFVAVATVSGGPAVTFSVERILKGSKRYLYRDDSYFVQCPVPARVGPLLDRDTKYLLFLSDSRIQLTPSVPVYSAIKGSDGVVVADQAALKAAAEALKGPGTMPALLPVVTITIITDPPSPQVRDELFGWFEQAAGDRCKVARCTLFTDSDAEWGARKARELLPGTDVYVGARVSRPDGTNKSPWEMRMTAIRITSKIDEVVFDERRPLAGEKDMVEWFAKLIGRICPQP